MNSTDEALSPGTDNRWAPPRRGAWFAIAGGPAAWALHLGAGWLVSGAACRRGTPSWGPLSAGGVWMLQAAVGIVAVGLALAALAVAVREWRASANHRVSQIHADARPDFLAAVALLVSASFLLAVIYDAVAQVMLPLCEAVR